jgi:hypothetical protein
LTLKCLHLQTTFYWITAHLFIEKVQTHGTHSHSIQIWLSIWRLKYTAVCSSYWTCIHFVNMNYGVNEQFFSCYCENKFHFNEMMVSALYQTNWIFILLAHWNNSPRGRHGKTTLQYKWFLFIKVLHLCQYIDARQYYLILIKSGNSVAYRECF